MSEQLKKIKQLVELREKARLGGGEVAIDKQHAKGKATARERIARGSWFGGMGLNHILVVAFKHS